MNRDVFSLVATMVFLAILGLLLLGIAAASQADTPRHPGTYPSPSPGPVVMAGGGSRG